MSLRPGFLVYSELMMLLSSPSIIIIFFFKSEIIYILGECDEA